jgi:ectoine hydroxylase-related dioxygenase (phytanoyl-CoA dioxygenase family)
MRQFAHAGYIVLPDAVGEQWLAAADQEIEALVSGRPPSAGVRGPHFYFEPPEQLPAADAALRESGALEAAEQLVAPHHLDHQLDHIQIALNIPPYDHRPGGPHIDGHRPEQASPASFTLLAAVFLSDESAVDAGNLWVWPGSHRTHAEVFAERGSTALLAASGHVTMLMPPVPLGRPRPVLAKRGDLLLAHFLLGHNTGGNLTDRVRRTIYYRLGADGHADRWADTFLDPLTEFAPVCEALAAG